MAERCDGGSPAGAHVGVADGATAAGEKNGEGKVEKSGVWVCDCVYVECGCRKMRERLERRGRVDGGAPETPPADDGVCWAERKKKEMREMSVRAV